MEPESLLSKLCYWIVFPFVLLFSPHTAYHENVSFTDFGIYETDSIGIHHIFAKNSLENLFLKNPAIIDFTDIKKIKKQRDKYTHQPGLHIILFKTSKEKFAMATKRNIGNAFSVVWNNKVVLTPIVMQEISSGEINITLASEDIRDEILESFKLIKQGRGNRN